MYESELPTEYIYDYPKKIVNEVKSPDLNFNYSSNPYQGCEHGCSYCYARTTHDFWGFNSGLDFEKKIVVKPEAPKLLERWFNNKNWSPDGIMLSGNTDCYQPAERKFEITRNMLKVFAKFKNPVSIITKNNLILRDLDLLKTLATDNLVKVAISITTMDESLRRKLEPRTSTIENRWKIIEALSKNDIPVGVMMAPIIPGINSHEIPSIVKMASEKGALDVMYSVVRLNGVIKEIFADWLENYYPDRKEKVLSLTSNLHQGSVGDSQWKRRFSGDGEEALMIKQLFETMKRKYFTDKKMPSFDLTKFSRNGQYSLFN